MGTISLSIPQAGLPNSSEDPKIASDFSTIQTVINGNIDTNNISATAAIKFSQLAGGDTGWVALTLNANCLSVAGSYTPSYRVVGTTVYLKGMISANSNTSTLYTVPGAALPASNVYIGIVTTTNVALTTFNAKTAQTGSVIVAGDTVALNSITYSLT